MLKIYNDLVKNVNPIPFTAPQLPFTGKVLQFKSVYVIKDIDRFYFNRSMYVLKNNKKHVIILKGSNYNGIKNK